MSSFFSSASSDDEVDNPSNPGNDPNFNAGDQHAENESEAAAKADYDDQVGSDEHEQAVADAREGAGIDDPPTEED
jgi:hypothetical protein